MLQTMAATQEGGWAVGGTQVAGGLDAIGAGACTDEAGRSGELVGTGVGSTSARTG